MRRCRKPSSDYVNFNGITLYQIWEASSLRFEDGGKNLPGYAFVRGKVFRLPTLKSDQGWFLDWPEKSIPLNGCWSKQLRQELVKGSPGMCLLSIAVPEIKGAWTMEPICLLESPYSQVQLKSIKLRYDPPQLSCSKPTFLCTMKLGDRAEITT